MVLTVPTVLKYTGYLRKIAFFVAWLHVHDDIGGGYLRLDPVLDAMGEIVCFVDMKLSAREKMEVYVFIAPGMTGPQFVETGHGEGHPADRVPDLAFHLVIEA